MAGEREKYIIKGGTTQLNITDSHVILIQSS